MHHAAVATKGKKASGCCDASKTQAGLTVEILWLEQKSKQVVGVTRTLWNSNITSLSLMIVLPFVRALFTTFEQALKRTQRTKFEEFKFVVGFTRLN